MALWYSFTMCNNITIKWRHYLSVNCRGDSTCNKEQSRFLISSTWRWLSWPKILAAFHSPMLPVSSFLRALISNRRIWAMTRCHHSFKKTSSWRSRSSHRIVRVMQIRSSPVRSYLCLSFKNIKQVKLTILVFRRARVIQTSPWVAWRSNSQKIFTWRLSKTNSQSQSITKR